MDAGNIQMHNQYKTANLSASSLLVLVGEKLMHEWENKRKGENNGQESVRVCESCYSSHPVLAVLACDCRVQQTAGCSAAVLHAAQAVKKQWNLREGESCTTPATTRSCFYQGVASWWVLGMSTQSATNLISLTAFSLISLPYHEGCGCQIMRCVTAWLWWVGCWGASYSVAINCSHQQIKI